ncbi:MAG: M55 family metallopeptidase [Candidatus Aminicenantales bacterium]
MMRFRHFVASIVVAFLSTAILTFSAFGQQKLKVFISVDMEGISGVVHGEQTSSSGRDYGLARRWMTGDVNAAIRGALKAGATEVVVNDSHGSMRNVIASELHPAASLITGSPKPLSMMQGIDATFDAVMLVGYHARAGSENGVLDHTYSGGSVYSIRVNGLELGEAGLNALIAGTFGVPVVLVTGDKEVCRQVRETVGENLVTAVVKEGVGRYAAKTLTPEVAQKVIEEKAREALEKRDQTRPFRLDPPFTFELNFLRSSMADAAELIPQVERVNPRTLRFVSEDYIQGFKLLRALIALAR